MDKQEKIKLKRYYTDVAEGKIKIPNRDKERDYLSKKVKKEESDSKRKQSKSGSGRK